jgi:fatty acid/phospholipid biosynthesis enzyme
MGASCGAHRPLSRELADHLIARTRAVPELQILLLTDPINDVYGGAPSQLLAELRQAGVDVVVTDGFTGNVALKSMEGLAKLIVEQLRAEFTRDLPSKLSALLAKPVLRRVGEKLDPRRYNGACMVGLTAVVVKSHGSADALAFAQAIATAATAMRRGLPAAIANALANAPSPDKAA